MYLATHKAAAKQEHLFNKPGFVEHLSPTYVAQQSVTESMAMTFMNLVTLKVRAKHELLFNKLASDSEFGSQNSEVGPKCDQILNLH
jgi:hypothetical protein